MLCQTVRVTQTRWPAARICTGDTEAAPDMIQTKARDRFNMNITDTKLEFSNLHERQAAIYLNYPHSTMLDQSLCSIVLEMKSLLSPLLHPLHLHRHQLGLQRSKEFDHSKY